MVETARQGVNALQYKAGSITVSPERQRTHLTLNMNRLQKLPVPRILLFAVLFASSPRSCLALNNGVGVTPAMGWNPYNAFSYAAHYFSSSSINVVVPNVDAALSSPSIKPRHKP